jgi:hypothetical protein
VPVTQAALGGTLTVPTVDGDEVEVQVPAGTQPGTVLVVRRAGLPAQGGGRRGDLRLLVKVEVPTDLDGSSVPCSSSWPTCAASSSPRAARACSRGSAAPSSGEPRPVRARRRPVGRSAGGRPGRARPARSPPPADRPPAAVGRRGDAGRRGRRRRRRPSSTMPARSSARPPSTPAPRPVLRVAQGLPKGRKLDEVVRVCTELGVDELVPVAADRCVVRLDERKAAKAVERWDAVARSASEQARRPFRPRVTPVTGPVTSPSATGRSCSSPTPAGPRSRGDRGGCRCRGRDRRRRSRGWLERRGGRPVDRPGGASSGSAPPCCGPSTRPPRRSRCSRPASAAGTGDDRRRVVVR